MASIEIKLKSGEVKKFPHTGRPGGSYTKRVRYEGAFVIVEDEYGRTNAYPAEDVEEVKTWPSRW